MDRLHDLVRETARGDAIPDSTLFRNFCCECRSPIRVPASARHSRACRCDGCRRLSRSGVPRLARARLH